MSASPVRAALVGHGYWGRRLLAITGRVEALGVVQVVDERAHADGFDGPQALPCHPTLEPVLRDPSVDAVLVTVPSVGHAEVVARSLRAGKHVFVEKPLATKVAHARELVELARDTGLMLTVDHQYWWSAEYAALAATLADGRVGDVVGISVQRVSGGPRRQDVSAWWDLACHDVSVLTRLGLLAADDPDSPRVKSYTGVPDGPVDGCVSVSARTRAGVELWVHVCWMSTTRRRRMVVAGKAGNLFLEEDDEALALWLEQAGQRTLLSRTPKSDRGTPIESALTAFADGVRGAPELAPDLGPAAAAVDVVAVLEGLEESAVTGGTRVAGPGCWL